MSTLVWPEIFFIRHGQTDWNAEKRYQGRQDIPLNDKGRVQADQNGLILRALLKQLGLSPPELEWHASPLKRAEETVRRVRGAFDQPLPDVQLDPRLVEISFGILEGHLHSELPPEMATAPGDRSADYWSYRPEGGENYVDVVARLEAFGLDLSHSAVVVSHGGIARALRVLIEGCEVEESLNWHPPQDVVMRFSPGAMELVGPRKR